MDRFAEFLRRQIDIDLELLSMLRADTEAGTAKSEKSDGFPGLRGFRECELKTRMLALHQYCGSGNGPCDRVGDAYLPEDERGCLTRAILGLPYTDRPGYRPRWRP